MSTDTIENFDLIIVGSGSGNSIPEYLHEWKIALVERDVFGGTCLNRGCIPSKMFVYPADVAVGAQSSAKLGLDTQFNGADWSAIRDRVFGLIDPIAASGREYRAHGTPNVTLIEGTAAFIDERTLDIDRVQLLARWNGRYASLWRGPAMLATTPRPGTRGPAVDWLREQVLPGSNITTGAPYDDTLRSGVTLLQQARGLPADGIAGPLTLMAVASDLPGPHLLRALD